MRWHHVDTRLVLETWLILETRLCIKTNERPNFYMIPGLYQKFYGTCIVCGCEQKFLKSIDRYIYKEKFFLGLHIFCGVDVYVQYFQIIYCVLSSTYILCTELLYTAHIFHRKLFLYRTVTEYWLLITCLIVKVVTSWFRTYKILLLLCSRHIIGCIAWCLACLPVRLSH